MQFWVDTPDSLLPQKLTVNFIMCSWQSKGFHLVWRNKFSLSNVTNMSYHNQPARRYYLQLTYPNFEHTIQYPLPNEHDPRSHSHYLLVQQIPSRTTFLNFRYVILRRPMYHMSSSSTAQTFNSIHFTKPIHSLVAKKSTYMQQDIQPFRNIYICWNCCIYG